MELTIGQDFLPALSPFRVISIHFHFNSSTPTFWGYTFDCSYRPQYTSFTWFNPSFGPIRASTVGLSPLPWDIKGGKRILAGGEMLVLSHQRQSTTDTGSALALIETVLRIKFWIFQPCHLRTSMQWLGSTDWAMKSESGWRDLSFYLFTVIFFRYINLSNF